MEEWSACGTTRKHSLVRVRGEVSRIQATRFFLGGKEQGRTIRKKTETAENLIMDNVIPHKGT